MSEFACTLTPIGKPVAMMGASLSPLVFIGSAASKFNAQGELTDEVTKELIFDLLLALKKLHLQIK